MLGIVTGFTIVMIALAGQLTVTMQVADLLPQGDPKVEQFNTILDEFATPSNIVIVVQGEERRIKAFAVSPLAGWLSHLLGWTGAGVFVAAIWLLWRSHADLGRSFSPGLEIPDDHALVTERVFKYIRHPMYSAHVLWSVAQLLLLQNWIAGPAMLVAQIPLYLYRIPREERMMLEQFGEDYRRYMDRTGRVVPRFDIGEDAG